MACTTFLYDSELNYKFKNKELQDVLDEARKITGRNWQVVPLEVTVRKSFFKKEKQTLYGVYLYVGGFGPWQQINFYNEHSESSINLYVSLDVVIAYFLGMLVQPVLPE
jgi:hypothetical protein